MDVETTTVVPPDVNISLMLTMAQQFLHFVQANPMTRANFVRRPIYNIAAMVNSIDRVDYVLDLGANGLQIDIEYFSSGEVSYARFGAGPYCNCLRHECESGLNVTRLFSYIRDTTSFPTGKYSGKLALFVLALKLENVGFNEKYVAGVSIGELIVFDLWYGVSVENAVNVLVSAKTVDDKQVLDGARETVKAIMPKMLHKLGYDLRDETNIPRMKHMYQSLGLPGNYWQNVGFSTCLRADIPTQKLQDALDLRDYAAEDRYVEKVYELSVDLPEQMEQSLVRGVDAIITNRPGRLAHLLKNDYPWVMRLATVHDNPWTRFEGWQPFLKHPRQQVVRLGDDFLEIVPHVND